MSVEEGRSLLYVVLSQLPSLRRIDLSSSQLDHADMVLAVMGSPYACGSGISENSPLYSISDVPEMPTAALGRIVPYWRYSGMYYRHGQMEASPSEVW